LVPELPPLADPELFEAVFLQNFSTSESKYLPHYGDSLLKAMTFDVLSELLGKENFKIISNITPFAISNAFYEQIVLHYGLERLTPYDRSYAKPSRGTTHARGDLLEAYMAAIEKDISREGQGYREVRDWLFRVLALRLRRLEPAVQEGGSLYSNGTEKQSFTLLPPPATAGPSIEHFGAEANPSGPQFVSLGNSTGRKALTSSTEAMDIWRHPDRQLLSESKGEGNRFMIMESSERSVMNRQLDNFRRSVFDLMKRILQNSFTAGSTWNVNMFWNTLSGHFSELQSMLQDDCEKILQFYYRVSHH
jgi:hypothetical protein